MCERAPTHLQSLKGPVSLSALRLSPEVIRPEPTLELLPQGSRRRRLWELDDHAHCPVVGVCLPMPTLRRLTGHVLGHHVSSNDYELHCSAIAECKRRTPMAEALQRELDQRYMAALRLAAKIKTTEALTTWWQEASRGKDLAGAFWATLTHARCTHTLEHDVLGEIHMLQHQVGVARNVDLQRFEALNNENTALTRELTALQQRSTREGNEAKRRVDALQSEVMQLRAQLIQRDTHVATLQQQLQTLEAAAPGLKSRFELARENARLIELNHQHQRALLQAEHALEQQRPQAENAAEPHAEITTATPTSAPTSARLDDHAVLCVGGRPASVPLYRQLIERTGGRFLHHDGGTEDSAAKLDATLAAADLVICQTGCISHAAYWRVKDHCKRTGKRCVFVENPSQSGLKRALLMLVPATEICGTPIASNSSSEARALDTETSPS